MRCFKLLSMLLAAIAGRGIVLAADAPALKAYRASRIVVGPGNTVEDGHLLVRAELVEGVLSSGEKPPAGVEVLDLGEVLILPGLVNPLSTISERSYRGDAGPVPSVLAREPRDARRLSAAGSVMPEEAVWRRLGRSGYAAFGWLPDAGAFLAGQAAVLRPGRGKTGDKPRGELVVKEGAYLLLGYEAGKRWRDVAEGELKKAADTITKEKEAVKKAEEKKAEEKKSAEVKSEEKKSESKPEEKKGEEKKAPAPPAAQPPPQAPAAPPRAPDPLVLALKGELPLFIRVRTPASLDHFFRFFDALSVKPSFVLVTAPQPADCVEKLVRRKDQLRGVVIEPRVEAFRESSVLVASARLFHENAIPVAFVPLADTLEGHERMFFFLAEMVKCGVPQFDTLASVTTVPARMLGLEGKLGTLEKGAFASFCVYRGEPLSGSARLLRAFIDGEEVFSDDPTTSSLSGEALK